VCVCVCVHTHKQTHTHTHTHTFKLRHPYVCKRALHRHACIRKRTSCAPKRAHTHTHTPRTRTHAHTHTHTHTHTRTHTCRGCKNRSEGVECLCVAHIVVVSRNLKMEKREIESLRRYSEKQRICLGVYGCVCDAHLFTQGSYMFEYI